MNESAWCISIHILVLLWCSVTTLMVPSSSIKLRRRRMVAWFRNDLRVADNPLINIIAKYNQLQQQQNLGLTCSTDDGSSNSTYIPKYDVDLVCLFCIDERYFKPTQHSPHKTGLFRSKFLIESVLNLRDNLKSKLGRSLLITTIPPEIIIPRLCHQSHDLYDVFVQAEVASEEVEIERRVENALRSLSPSLSLSSSPSKVLHRIIGGSTLYHPQDLPFRPDCSDLPNIFSDFRHALEQGLNKISIRPLLPTISANMLPVDVDDVHGLLSTAGTCGIDDDAWSRNHTDAPCSYEFVPTLLDLGFSSADVEEYDRNEPLRSKGVLTFVGGEDEAVKRLQTWMFHDDHLKDYFDIRNGMLGEAYSSKLSPWLALGCISPRLVYHESKRYESERAIANKSTYWMHFELMVRDFFHFYCKKHGRRVFLKGGVLNSPEAKRWTLDGERIRRWKTGTTGQPLVDANMRELLYTGWMSNRGRQNVASYLVFDLGVDWRVGADHFESYLIDHDVCQNYGNWNSIAGLTVKKLSKFNCVKQSKDYDPEGKYIAHWVPELGSIPVPWRFQPSAMVDQCECDQYQLVLGSDYPTDISGNYDKVLIKLPAKRSVKPTVKGNIKKYFQTQPRSRDVNGAGGSRDNGGTAEKDTSPTDERTDYRSVWW